MTLISIEEAQKGNKKNPADMNSFHVRLYHPRKREDGSWDYSDVPAQSLDHYLRKEGFLEHPPDYQEPSPTKKQRRKRNADNTDLQKAKA